MKNLLKEWKHRLGLDDWVIKLKDDCSPNEMFLKDCAGDTEWQETSKTAFIQILNKKDYGQRVVDFDKEETLIHELLHLKFCLLGESGNNLQDRLLHQLIDDMAKALVDAKRSNNE